MKSRRMKTLNYAILVACLLKYLFAKDSKDEDGHGKWGAEMESCVCTRKRVKTEKTAANANDHEDSDSMDNDDLDMLLLQLFCQLF